MKTKLIPFSLLLLFFFGSCQKEATNIPPTSMTITKIVVTDFSNGGWDTFPTSNPDIYIQVSTGNSCSGSILFDSNYYSDASPGNNQTFTPPSAINIDPTSTYAICLYDFDDLSSDDYIGGVSFTPYESGGGRPSYRTISAGNISYQVYFTYN